MPRSQRRLFITALLAVAVSVLPSVALGSHSWGGYHWARTSNPFTLKVGDNVSGPWDAVLDTTVSDWTASSVLELTKVTGGTRPKPCKATTGRVEVCNASYGNTGWLGIAQIWLSGGTHISQAVTKLNDTYFTQAQYNTPAWRRLVTCQEIAHDFGLDHQDETFDNANLGSCMDYTNDPDGGAGGASPNDPSNEHPNQHDYDQLVTIYSHLDLTATAGAALPATVPPAMRQIVLSGVEQFGPVVKAVSNGGGLATYHEQDFGNGNKVITHVFWTLESNRNHGE
jgi:hypothetical protein